MNNPYHWLNEQMVKHEMQEVDRAIAQARLLKEAGISRTSLLARGVNALRSLLKARSERVQERHPVAPESYLLSEKKECQG